MAKTPAASPTSPENLQSLVDALLALKLQLRQAYWSTPDEDAGDVVTAAADACSDIASQLMVGDIQSRTSEFALIKDHLAVLNKRLQAIQHEIDKIVRAIDVGVKVAKGIDQVLTLAAKVLK